MTRRPAEVLAPAGDLECLQAAIENGADAVYFGLQHGFNARFRAGNFTLDELPETMRLLHRRSVKGYVTLNTLVFPSELPTLEVTLRGIAAADVDAILVQDFGVARLAREVCPQLPLHASTQMTLTCAQSIAAAAELGIERVVLPREASLHDLQRIAHETSMPLEVFVHGALCVAYSGQCLTSESLGGRSANRGQCAQACRLPYDLICDGEDVGLGAQKYLLSPQDLAIYELVPQLLDIGIASLKIEGRLKSAEYVAATTRQYRRAVDAAVANIDPGFTQQDAESLEQTFSRGLSHGWTEGCDHKMLVPGLSSAKRGVFAGTIRSISQRGVTIQVATSLAAGDGIVFEGDREAKDEQGGRIYELFQGNERCRNVLSHGQVELRFAHNTINFSALSVGQKLWKTDDPRLMKQLRSTFSSNSPQRKLALRLTVEAKVGHPLRVVATVAAQTTADDSPLNKWGIQLSSDHVLAKAERHSVDKSFLAKQFGRLGNTQFRLDGFQATIGGDPMVPLSVIGRMRKELIEQLDATLTKSHQRKITANGAIERIRQRDSQQCGSVDAETDQPKLFVLCRELAQLESVLATKPDGIYLEFHDVRQYRSAADILRSSAIPWYLATLRIQLPDEHGLLRVLDRTQPHGFLVRHLAAMDHYKKLGRPMIADFSLNAANDLSAAWIQSKGACRVTPSYDLNREQLLELVASGSSKPWEVVVHQHMPMFHMQHCVYCAVLSPGKNKTDCGRPCDRHVVELRDRKGKQHRLGADIGCRNTVYNATPQSAAEAIPALLVAGVKNFRVELLDESSEEINQLVSLYRSLLLGDVSPRHVWQTLKAANRVGVTRGTLEDRPELLGAMSHGL